MVFYLLAFLHLLAFLLFAHLRFFFLLSDELFAATFHKSRKFDPFKLARKVILTIPNLEVQNATRLEGCAELCINASRRTAQKLRQPKIFGSATS